MIGAVHNTVFSTDVEATRAFFGDVLELESVAELAAKGVELARPVSDEGFGLVAYISVPGLGQLGVYEPRHPSPLGG